MYRTCVSLAVWTLLFSIGAAGWGNEPAVPADDAALADDSASAPAEAAPRVRGVIIPVSGMISDVTTKSIRRRGDQAIAEGADMVVLELDTPGGQEPDAAQDGGLGQSRCVLGRFDDRGGLR